MRKMPFVLIFGKQCDGCCTSQSCFEKNITSFSQFNDKKKLINALKNHEFTKSISIKHGIDHEEIVKCIDKKFLDFVMDNTIVFYNYCELYDRRSTTDIEYGTKGGC